MPREGTTRSAWIASMAQPSSPAPMTAVAEPDSLPGVRLELRPGTPRATFHDVHGLGFIVGSVAGCDLRLPGADLPPVICLIVRHTAGLSFRKLVPTQPILVNGRNAP